MICNGEIPLPKLPIAPSLKLSIYSYLRSVPTDISVLPPPMREMVIDRAMAVSGDGLELDDIKIIVLMVFWSLGEEPDALILDELFVHPEDRLYH